MQPSIASASGPAPTEAGSARAAARSSQDRERHHGREVDARIVEARDERLQAPAPLGKGQGAQVLVALGQDVVDAQMRRKIGDQLRGHGLPVQALLQHVEALHPSVAHDQQLAVDGALEIQRLDEIGKGAGDILAGAGIDPPHRAPVAAVAGDGLEADAVPFPLGQEFGGVELREILVLQRMREHGRAKRRRIAGFGLRPAPLDPGEQVLVGRLQPMPDQLDLVGLEPAELGDGGLGEPRRDADPQFAGDQLEKRPAPGLVERIEPAGDPGREIALARGRERLDDLGEGRDVRRRVVVADGRGTRGREPRSHAPARARSGPPSRRDRRHNGRTSGTAPGRSAPPRGRGSGRAWPP